jgi:hypothetical protein
VIPNSFKLSLSTSNSFLNSSKHFSFSFFCDGLGKSVLHLAIPAFFDSFANVFFSLYSVFNIFIFILRVFI